MARKQGQGSKCIVAEGHLDDAQDARKSTVVGCPPCMTSLSPSRATAQYNHADLLTHCTPLQVAESIARKPVDFGRLVFTDLTTTRCAKYTLAAVVFTSAGAWMLSFRGDKSLSPQDCVVHSSTHTVNCLPGCLPQNGRMFWIPLHQGTAMIGSVHSDELGYAVGAQLCDRQHIWWSKHA